MKPNTSNKNKNEFHSIMMWMMFGLMVLTSIALVSTLLLEKEMTKQFQPIMLVAVVLSNIGFIILKNTQ